MALVAISHGHELTTPGKRTPPIPELNNRVIKENEFNKATALILEADLIRHGIDVIDVSATDNDTLADRVKRANDAKADILLLYITMLMMVSLMIMIRKDLKSYLGQRWRS